MVETTDGAGHGTSGFALPHVGFDALPAAQRRRLYGVDYVYVNDAGVGEMHITREGWPFREWLQPDRWYAGRHYVSIGKRLSGGTGAVYWVPVETDRGRRELVIKFSRFAQAIPPFAPDSTFPAGTPMEAIAAARFNNPYEEFGLLREVRLGRHGPRNLHILTKRPLAIYSPAQEYPGWRLGRDGWLFERHQRDAEEAQPEPGIEQTRLNPRRDYIMLFQWVKGEDALSLYRRGVLSLEDLDRVTQRANDDLQLKGFRVLDNKPGHVILRPRKDGRLLKRHGQWVYALVDFELLQRTEEYAAAMSAAMDDGSSAAKGV